MSFSNKGKRTPGVDGVLWRTPAQKLRAASSLRRHGYKPMPLRRIYIPKRSGHKKRPLSIPTLYDRAMQALHMFSLVPIAETLADGNSYGFREHRRCADAMAYCHVCLSNQFGAEHILEGDIRSCFDEISHTWLFDHIPMDKEILKKFLQAGYMEQGKYYHSKNGTPQGGIISPVLANMALDGMEDVVRRAVPRRSRVNFIRYADDFIIFPLMKSSSSPDDFIFTAKSEELLTDKVLPALSSFLAERGLELSSEKTLITHIETGFDFQGQNVRKYRGKSWRKVLIKPSTSSVKRIRENIRATLKKSYGWQVKDVIKALNSRIRGWAYYHRHVASGDTFAKLDHYLYQSLWRWLRRRHHNKSKKWLSRKYWSQGDRPSTFAVLAKEKKGQKTGYRLYQLIRFSSIRIWRHIKVRSEANPYDPRWIAYFDERKKGKRFRPVLFNKA